MALLSAYAEAITPWAERTASSMLEDVNRAGLLYWMHHANEMSLAMRRQLRSTKIGGPLRILLADQVDLIKSIPLEAAQRVHKLTQEALVTSQRASEIADLIQNSTEVATSRAILIARTEVSRTSSVLTEVRAADIGSEAYIWETSKDKDVRVGHKMMQGTLCRWDTPPAVVENGRVMHFHAGRIWNCRCWCRPVLP